MAEEAEWETPKCDWSSTLSEGVLGDDLNRIERNTQYLKEKKADLESPTFIGIVNGISATMVGLDQVDNTADVNKPVSNLTNTAINVSLPVGSVIMFAARSAPAGWLLCTGDPLTVPVDDTDDLWELFIAIGYTWGGSELAGVFNLPPSQDRVALGARFSTNNIGQTGGSNELTVTTANLPNGLLVDSTVGQGNWNVSGAEKSIERLRGDAGDQVTNGSSIDTTPEHFKIPYIIKYQPSQ